MREINNFVLSEAVQLYKKQEVTRITEDQMTLNPFHGTCLFLCPHQETPDFIMYSGSIERDNVMKWVKHIFDKYVTRILIFMIVP